MGADLGRRVRQAAAAGLLRGVPAGEVRVEPLGCGESYSAWLVQGAEQARVVRVARRPREEMPRPMEAELAALERVPSHLGSRALGAEPDPDNPLGAPYMVVTHVPGRVMTPQDWSPQLGEQLAAQLVRLHRALADPPAPEARTLTPVGRTAHETLAWWRAHHPGALADPLAAGLIDPWLERVQVHDPAFVGTPLRGRVHGDVVVTNVIIGPDGVPRFIDFEWAEHEDPAKDLALIGGGIVGGPWYAPLSRDDVVALVAGYARRLRRDCVPGEVADSDPERLLARRDAWELLDRMGNLLYCLSRAEQGGYRRWAQSLSAGLSRALGAGA
ncbi:MULTISPECIES: phosphotransferase [unclassified Actinomyces]|uniref:phosphotransferase enzyme family protein n=2 Tax=Actinomyces TaxID=1654 RepID=UPI002017F481|nr:MULTISPECIES: phosphotransferase [unclassified Actinomyces]MCL3776951.1 aminoglycoside phosphotransferase family protein [Actinomyces sp. AC-20-1]MCL3789188.1 aminoglycoside phosphotransferase family protein [Actinomyces sp. 187325]MCL3791929.1 aminoglycoside phosphotransferase family protein [Actinomyces sp. 186855]MCL3794546.1 aminoglycoside phosphotransferase family protein [Actinomyces sp. 217892]